MNRKARAQMGQHTLSILEAGFYTVEDQRIELADQLSLSRTQTEAYPRERTLDVPPPRFETTEIVVQNQTTLEACQALVYKGYDVAALNFASAKNPGGGFLSGSQAQEESLARSSGLYNAICDQPMYTFHRELRDPMYTAYALYSPKVVVFRNDAGDLLPKPYACAFITAPAPNASAVLKRAPERKAELEAQMALRIDRVLCIARLHAHDALVLGAWGCGVFGNVPDMVAEKFRDAMHAHRGAFRKVVFAVLDSSSAQTTIQPFERHFCA